MKSPMPKASPFTNVAHILANGKPLPKWLIQDLEREQPTHCLPQIRSRGRG